MENRKENKKSNIDVQYTVPYNLIDRRYSNMLAVNYTQFREKMKHYMDVAVSDNETVVVTRKNENVVMVSESAFNNIMENLYLMSNSDYYKDLLKGMEEIENGHYEFHELIED